MGPKARLGEILLEAGEIDAAQLDAALREQEESGRPLGITLVRMGALREDVLVQNLARQLSLPMARLAGKRIAPEVLELVPRDLAEKHRCFPLFVRDEGEGRALYLGMEDPSDLDAIDRAGAAAGLRVRPVLVAPSEIEEAVRSQYAPAGAVDPAAAAWPFGDPADSGLEPPQDEPGDEIAGEGQDPDGFDPGPAHAEVADTGVDELDPGSEAELDVDSEPELDPGSEPELDPGSRSELDPGGEPELDGEGRAGFDLGSEADLGGSEPDFDASLDIGLPPESPGPLPLPDPADAEAASDSLPAFDDSLGDFGPALDLDPPSEEFGSDADPVAESVAHPDLAIDAPESGPPADEAPRSAVPAAPPPDSASVPRDAILRALTQLLVEKGLIERDELIERVHRESQEG